MTWGAIVVGVVGAGVSAANAKSAKAAANRNAKAANAATAAGSTSDPWGPSTDYRIAGMQRADTLWKQRNDPSFGGYAGGANGSLDVAPAAGNRASNPLSARYKGSATAKGGAGGAGGGKGGGGFDGTSPETRSILGSLTDRAAAGHPLYDPSTAFTQKLLAGEETDPYRAQAWDRISNINDPDLQRFKDMLFSGQMPGTAGGSSGGGGSRGGGGMSSSGAGGAGGDLVGAREALKARIAGGDLDVNNPHVQAMIDAVTRDTKKQFTDVKIPGINDTFTGSGRFGGGLYGDALANAGGQYASELADEVGTIRYNEYEARKKDQSDALGLGTQYDIASEDRAAQAAAASQAAGAAGYAADRESTDRMSLARMGALQDAIGMGVDLSKFSGSGMMTLSQMYGQDQMGALGMVPELSGMDIRDMSAAGNLSLGADSNRNTLKGIQSQRSTAMAALNWQKQMYANEQPWQDQMRYADLINSYSSGYGKQSGGAYTPAAYTPNMWGQALQGGLGGYMAAGGNFSWGGTKPPAGQYPAGPTGGPATPAGGW